MKNLSKFFKFLVLVSPVVLYFSYFPVIRLGANGSMNFELSLPLLWLVLFDVVGFVLMAQKKLLFCDIKKRWMWLLFPLWLSITALWSLNFIRGVLVVGILWLLYFAGYAVWSLKDLFDFEFRRKFWWWFFGASLGVCCWCILQCILDLVGVVNDYSLMCVGCTYSMFGFPHPNGFAIEPQFMGNLLLAPAIIAAWLLVVKQKNKILEWERSRDCVFNNRSGGLAPKLQFRRSSVTAVKNTVGSRSLYSKILFFCFFIIVTTLFLTFSRGAIYSLVVGLVFMTAYVVVREKKARKKIVKRVGVVWGVVVLSFLFALNLQGLMAEVSPTDDTYKTGVAKVLNHLSLGVIDIREEKPVSGETYAPESDLTGAEDDSLPEKSAFDGYVAESTDTRVKLTGAALEVWSKNFATMMFGVGLGGAGQALYVNGFTSSPKEIVQNQYASLLLETGVIGVVLMILALALIIRIVIKNQLYVGVLALIVAYLVSLCFFAGLPNALHIYLLPVILLVMMKKTAKR